MQLKITSLCRLSLRTKVGKQNSAAAWKVLLDFKGKSKMGSIRSAMDRSQLPVRSPWLLRGGFCQHSPLPTGRASSWAARQTSCVPCSHRVTTGSGVGGMFCLPGTRPLDPTHHQPSLGEAARASAKLITAWARPPSPYPAPFPAGSCSRCHSGRTGRGPCPCHPAPAPCPLPAFLQLCSPPH